MNKKILIGNWKMNPSNLIEAISIASGIEGDIKISDKIDTAIAPPFTFISEVSNVISKVSLAAQNVFWEDEGAYTGEVSAKQLKSLGVKYVIIGHSERRSNGETDIEINKKIKLVIEKGLIPILCIGESKKVRDDGVEKVKNFIEEQIKKDTKNINVNELVIAYEPIWAISSNDNARPATPDNIKEMIAFIKEITSESINVLYGGSVNPGNVKDFTSLNDLNGFLVGGASLRPKEFISIYKELL
ncbi:MAG: triose-phosphate isomerase [Candidatus Paceibacterota bacterium]